MFVPPVLCSALPPFFFFFGSAFILVNATGFLATPLCITIRGTAVLMTRSVPTWCDLITKCPCCGLQPTLVHSFVLDGDLGCSPGPLISQGSLRPVYSSHSVLGLSLWGSVSSVSLLPIRPPECHRPLTGSATQEICRALLKCCLWSSLRSKAPSNRKLTQVLHSSSRCQWPPRSASFRSPQRPQTVLFVFSAESIVLSGMNDC